MLRLNRSVPRAWVITTGIVSIALAAEVYMIRGDLAAARAATASATAQFEAAHQESQAMRAALEGLVDRLSPDPAVVDPDDANPYPQEPLLADHLYKDPDDAPDGGTSARYLVDSVSNGCSFFIYLWSRCREDCGESTACIDACPYREPALECLSRRKRPFLRRKSPSPAPTDHFVNYPHKGTRETAISAAADAGQ